MNCIPNQHIIILILIIIIVGSLAGVSNFLNFHFKNIDENKVAGVEKGDVNNKYEIWKYVVSGIGASILVPLLLNMLSSNLIKESKDFDQINYFVFAGFCFIAAYFSERFINSMGEKILQDLEKTKDRANEAILTAKENEEKLDFIVSSESEMDEQDIQSQLEMSEFQSQSPFVDDDIKSQTNQILGSFNEKFKFRTAKGIAKDLSYSVAIVETILNQLQSHGITKKLTAKSGLSLWGLTKVGQLWSEKTSKENPK